MTSKQIENARMKYNVKFEIAKQIRELLDAARKEYGPTEWDDNDMETEVLELVTSTE